jgi:dienelactone hydrolase
LTDVLGHGFINTQLIADEFASKGYVVVVPDLFHGDPVSPNPAPGFSVMKWISSPPGHLPPRVDPVVEASIDYIRNDLGCEKIGAVGYCFGV